MTAETAKAAITSKTTEKAKAAGGRRAIGIYSRKSKFTGKGESIENQIELCRRYVRMQAGEDALEGCRIYEDEGFSGGTLERPQFKAMMRDARQHILSMVIVYRLDRISRNIGDFAQLIEELNRLGVSFVSIREQFDTSSPMGRAMMYIASVFSQLERETIAERIRDNMLELAKTGRWLGGTTPTGYASESISQVTIDGKVKRCCKLRPIPEEAELIREIYRKYLASGSLTETKAWLNQTGRKTRKGNEFTVVSVRAILSNPVYAAADRETYAYFEESDAPLFSEAHEFDGSRGMIAYNRTVQKPGKTNRVRKMEEWVVTVGKHRPLIGGREWITAQRMLERNQSSVYRTPRNRTALLPGLLLCGECNSPMRPKLSAPGSGGESDRGFVYRCRCKEESRGEACQMKNAPGNWLDRAAAEAICSLAGDEEDWKRCLEEERNREKASLALRTTAQVTDQSTNQSTDQLTDWTTDRFAARPTAWETERKLPALAEMFAVLPIERKRELAGRLISRIVWEGDEAHLYWQEGESAAGGEAGCDFQSFDRPCGGQA